MTHHIPFGAGAPLHVQVARRLGWTGLRGYCRCPRPVGDHACQRVWYGRSPSRPDVEAPVPRFDREWGVTGELVERLRIHLRCRPDGMTWTASRREREAAPRRTRTGATALEAACRLLLAVAEEVHQAPRIA